MFAKPITGKCSTFGGPNDTGVAVKEGLALLTEGQWRRPIWRGLFLPNYNLDFGMARNLNPSAFYCACRWDYAKTPRAILAQSIVRVVSENGTCIFVRPVDWGPNIRTGRIIDLSPGAANALGVATDDKVEVTLVTPTSGLAQ